MSYVVYSFEAKSIQQYVLASSKLKDQIGASEQIEDLCALDGLLGEVINNLALGDEIDFARKNGGSFIAVFGKDLEENFQKAMEFQALWTLCVQKNLPGLHFTQSLSQDTKSYLQAVKNGQKQLRINQQKLFPRLPLAGPLTARSPRTGEPAVCVLGGKADFELLDEATDKKRPLSDGKRITDKLGNYDMGEIHWPKAMPENKEDFDNPDFFPIKDNNRYVGIFHADINNLGLLFLDFLQDVNDVDYVNDSKKFSEIIDLSIIKAAQKATEWMARDHPAVMPLRPLVLAGDDITFILRGDVTAKFARKFLEKLEVISGTLLKDLRKKYPHIPEYLTACAGIAYVKASQPFFQAYRLAESLCKTAKERSKMMSSHIVPSSIAFHRITTTLIEEYETIIEEELTQEKLILTMQPYLLGKTLPDKYPQFTDLLKLAKSLSSEQEGQHGKMRELMSLLYENKLEANRKFARWCEVVSSKTNRKDEDIVNHLKRLTGCSKQEGHNFTNLMAKDQGKRKTPLGDALSIIMVEKQ